MLAGLLVQYWPTMDQVLLVCMYGQYDYSGEKTECHA